MLFNIYIYIRLLGEIIQRFGVYCHQYADDTRLCISFSSSVVEAVKTLECCLAAGIDWTRADRQKLNPDKAETRWLLA